MHMPPFLLRLASHVPLSLSAQRGLGEEDAMAYQFVNELRVAVLEGRLDAIFLHPANELGGMVTVTKGRARVPLKVAIAKALGLITGTADYLFLWRNGCCALEAKSQTGSLRPAQRDFRDWCASQGVPFHVFRTVDEGLQILAGYGVYRESKSCKG